MDERWPSSAFQIPGATDENDLEAAMEVLRRGTHIDKDEEDRYSCYSSLVCSLDFVYMQACMHACMQAWKQASKLACKHACIYASIHACMLAANQHVCIHKQPVVNWHEYTYYINETNVRTDPMTNLPGDWIGARLHVVDVRRCCRDSLDPKWKLGMNWKMTTRNCMEATGTRRYELWKRRATRKTDEHWLNFFSRRSVLYLPRPGCRPWERTDLWHHIDRSSRPIGGSIALK